MSEQLTQATSSVNKLRYW